VVDVACGSGDAQTLCITDDDNVWSWGDGDYGKLGRGGSDGCKVPMKVDSLAGLGAVKVPIYLTKYLNCERRLAYFMNRSGPLCTLQLLLISNTFWMGRGGGKVGSRMG
jgi:hypothetical protein